MYHICIYKFGGPHQHHHHQMEIHIYALWQASDLPRLFLSARGESLSVGGAVLRSDALARALIPLKGYYGFFQICNLSHDGVGEVA